MQFTNIAIYSNETSNDKMLKHKNSQSIIVIQVHDKLNVGVQWLSGWVLDSRPRGYSFEPH